MKLCSLPNAMCGVYRLAVPLQSLKTEAKMSFLQLPCRQEWDILWSMK